MPTALEILRIVYLSLLSVISLTFETFPLPVTVTGRSSFAASLTNCAIQVFLSPPMNWLIRYLIRPINFPWFCKNLHYHKTEFCANFYKGPSFFNIWNPFANQFYNSGQRLTIEISISPKLCKGDYTVWKVLYRAFQQYHRPRNRALRFRAVLQYTLDIEQPS